MGSWYLIIIKYYYNISPRVFIFSYLIMRFFLNFFHLNDLFPIFLNQLFKNELISFFINKMILAISESLLILFIWNCISILLIHIITFSSSVSLNLDILTSGNLFTLQWESSLISVKELLNAINDWRTDLWIGVDIYDYWMNIDLKNNIYIKELILGILLTNISRE